MLLITTKQSNMLDDLETLRNLSKLLPEYCGAQSEEAVSARVFELSYAVDELVTPGGHREHVSVQQVKTFTEMDSHEEKLQKIIMESKMNQVTHTNRRKEKPRLLARINAWACADACSLLLSRVFPACFCAGSRRGSPQGFRHRPPEGRCASGRRDGGRWRQQILLVRQRQRRRRRRRRRRQQLLVGRQQRL